MTRLIAYVVLFLICIRTATKAMLSSVFLVAIALHRLEGAPTVVATVEHLRREEVPWTAITDIRGQ